MDSSDPGRRALVELDKVLREKPQQDGHAFGAATRALVQLRDTMIERHRKQPPDAADRRRLEHVNAVISTVLAGHFPLGSIPWHEIELARSWLAEIVETDETA